jgi:hypothetical protein
VRRTGNFSVRDPCHSRLPGNIPYGGTPQHLRHDVGEYEVVDHVGWGTPIAASEEAQDPNGLHSLGRGGRGVSLESQGVIDGHPQILEMFRRLYVENASLSRISLLSGT